MPNRSAILYGALAEALKATAMHRGSTERIADVGGIIKQISANDDVKNMWDKYQKKFSYARDISYDSIMGVLKQLLEK